MTHFINLSPFQYGAALLPSDKCGIGHRGIWFYDPTVQTEVNTGDEVRFIRYMDREEVMAFGIVTEVLDPRQFPKFCSALNSKGFRWRDKEPKDG